MNKLVLKWECNGEYKPHAVFDIQRLKTFFEVKEKNLPSPTKIEYCLPFKNSGTLLQELLC